MAGLFDGFDDDFELPARKPRAVPVNIRAVEACSSFWDYAKAAALNHTTQEAACELRASSSTLSAVESEQQEAWLTLCEQVTSLAESLANASFRTILRSDVAAKLVGVLTSVEAASTDLGRFEDVVRLLQSRVLEYVCKAEADCFEDSPGSGDTPIVYRAASVVLVAAACVGLFLQANWTGPELSTDDLEGIYPLPYCGSLSATLESEDGSSAGVVGAQATKTWAAVPKDATRIEQFEPSAGAAAAIAGAGATAAATPIEGDAAAGSASDASGAAVAVDGAAAPSQAAADDEADAMDDKAIGAMMQKRRAPLDAAALRGLQSGTHDCYEHVLYPHFLLTARALLTALTRPVGDAAVALQRDAATGEYGFTVAEAGTDGAPAAAAAAAGVLDLGSEAEEEAAVGLAPSVAASLRRSRLDPRLGKLYAATDRLPSAYLWAGRAAVLHQRSLVDRQPDKALWAECVAAFHAVGAAWTAPYLAAFTAGDVFQRSLVEADLAAATLNEEGVRVGAQVAGVSEEARAAAGMADLRAAPAAAAAAAAAAPPASPAAFAVSRSVVARLLLEWGHAQHYFGRTSAAKTSFFLARRESGLQTRLTGALGRRTKFQKFDLAQLVLRAASAGPENVAAALRDAELAERLGAADGKFSAKALRGMGLLAPSASATDATGGAGAGARVGVEAGAAAAASASAAAGVGAGAGTGAGAGAGAEAGAGEAAASPEGGDAALLQSAPAVLGGIRTVTLDALDASNILLEQVQFRDPALEGVETEGDKEKHRLFYGKGWGKAMERGGGGSGEAAPAAVGTPSLDAISRVPLAAAAGDAPAPSGEAAQPPAAADAAATAAAAPAAPAAPPAPSLEDGPLSALDQTVILALCLDIRNNNPSDGLTQEEMRPYVARALDTPLNWMVHSTGLLLKSLQELESHRTVERAVLQMQALVDQYTNRLTPLQASQRAIDESAPARDRLTHIFCVVFPPRWDLKRQLADRYRRLGVLRSALQLYEELEVWEDIIDMHIALERMRRAERLLRRRLALAPTPRLHCLLGHVTDRDEPFHTAWQLSGGTYAKARLDLGKRCLRRKDVDGAIEHLKAGLALAPQSNAEWFILGLTAMQTGRLELSLIAFSRVVQLEPSSADAWANIGSIHLRARNWAKGYAALEQALRKDRSDWRMYSNFLVACMRTRNYSRAISVMHRLVDLRQQAGGVGGEADGNEGVDEPSLGLLVQECIASLRDSAAAEEAAAAAAGTAAAAAAPGAHTAAASAGAPAGSSTGAPSVFGGIPVPATFDIDEGAGEGDPSDGTAQPPQPPPAAPAPAAGAGDAAEPAAAAHVDCAGQPAGVYLEPLAKLLGHITSVVTRSPKVWQLYARLHDARGRREDGTDCRLRMCRALQTAGWEKDADAIALLAQASGELVGDYLQDGSPRALLKAQMYVASVLNKVVAARVHEGCPAAERLRDLQSQVQAAQAVRAAGAAGAAGAGVGAGAGAEAAGGHA